MPLVKCPPGWEKTPLSPVSVSYHADNEERKEEARARRQLFNSPRPPQRRSYRDTPACPFGPVAPPAPAKLRREKADDIVETAMKLMDLALEQNRIIKRLEAVVEDNYSSN